MVRNLMVCVFKWSLLSFLKLFCLLWFQVFDEIEP